MLWFSGTIEEFSGFLYKENKQHTLSQREGFLIFRDNLLKFSAFSSRYDSSVVLFSGVAISRLRASKFSGLILVEGFECVREDSISSFTSASFFSFLSRSIERMASNSSSFQQQTLYFLVKKHKKSESGGKALKTRL